MMSELRAGGLAVVINSHTRENIGKVVKLHSFCGQGIGRYKDRSDMWIIKCISSKLKSQIFDIHPGESCYCPAAYLMPIDGEDFSHEEERQKGLTNG